MLSFVKRVILPIASVFIFFLLLGSLQIHTALSVASHVVVSEVQIAGGMTNDEFVELYNPTGDAIDLTGWRLAKKTQGGTESDLIASISGSIAPHGYFLIAHTDFDGVPTPDATYSGAIVAANNTVLVYDAGSSVTDKVGMGSATDVETAATSNPSANNSIERKASSTSDGTSMGPGGGEETAGNGEDTDNNVADFVSRSSPDPQNSASAVEPALETPTPTPSHTPTPTPSDTPTPTPSPSETPTPTPTEEPEPTDTPSSNVFFQSSLFTCSRETIEIHRFGFTFFFPKFVCVRT